MKKYIHEYVKCQRYKNITLKSFQNQYHWNFLNEYGDRWPQTSRVMFQEKDEFISLTTLVNTLSRRLRFVQLMRDDIALNVPDLLFDSIFKRYGLLDRILSDRDSKFRLEIGKRRMNRKGIELRMSASHHKQIDGAFEFVNRVAENYLRCCC